MASLPIKNGCCAGPLNLKYIVYIPESSSISRVVAMAATDQKYRIRRRWTWVFAALRGMLLCTV